MGVSLLTVLAHNAAVIEGVLPQEALWVVVAIDVNLSQGVVGRRLLTTFMNTSLQPRQQQLQSGEKGTQLELDCFGEEKLLTHDLMDCEELTESFNHLN